MAAPLEPTAGQRRCVAANLPGRLTEGFSLIDLHFWGLCILSDRRLLQISWPRPRLASVEALHDLFCEAAVNKHSRLTQCSVKECCWIPPAVQQYNEMKQGTERHDT